MNGIVQFIGALVASLLGGVASTCAMMLWSDRRKRADMKARALRGNGPEHEGIGQPDDNRSFFLRYAERLTHRLFIGSTTPLAPSVRKHKAGATRAGERYKRAALKAGCAKEVTVSAYCEACTRLALAGLGIGALFGALLSWQMALFLGVVGLCVGRFALPRAMSHATRKRALQAELHLSEMLEVVALGLRSGLTFDRSFELYGSHFDNEFARSCMKAYRSWTLGLCSREEALSEFAASYDCDQLSRVVDSIVRSLRFGSALAHILEEAGAQARAAYRAALEERVAKAPVKMMLPTGTLILPAMLLLVMGPVLLELSGGF